jgi:hypothetical protein
VRPILAIDQPMYAELVLLGWPSEAATYHPERPNTSRYYWLELEFWVIISIDPEAAGCRSLSCPQDRRSTKTLTVTSKGMDRLKAWVRDLRLELGTATPDPIRTRAQFLTSLSNKERAEFVEVALRVTSEALRTPQDFAANEGDLTHILDQLGILGATLELQGRIEWLSKVDELLPESP